MLSISTNHTYNLPRQLEQRLRTIKEKSNDAERLTRAFRLCVARPPTKAEHAAFAGLLKQAREFYKTHEAEAKALAGDAESSAWAATARIMLNMDEFITRE